MQGDGTEGDGTEGDLIDAARSCLAGRYGLAPSSVEVISVHSFNTVLRAETERGPVSMRIGTGPRIHPDATEAAEASWLDTLAGAGIGAPTPVRTVDGAPWTSVDGRRVSVFTWLDGPTLDDVRDEPEHRGWPHQAGRLLARLHEQAAAIAPHSLAIDPALRLDRPAYFGDDHLRTDIGPHWHRIGDALARVTAGLADLWDEPPHPPHLLHGDFGPRNLVVHGATLAPIDFQDVRLGFDVLDVGITVADLGRKDPELADRFLAGYRTVRPFDHWTPELARLATSARTLNMINLALFLGKPGMPATLDRLMEHL